MIKALITLLVPSVILAGKNPDNFSDYRKIAYLPCKENIIVTEMSLTDFEDDFGKSDTAMPKFLKFIESTIASSWKTKDSSIIIVSSDSYCNEKEKLQRFSEYVNPGEVITMKIPKIPDTGKVLYFGIGEIDFISETISVSTPSSGSMIANRKKVLRLEYPLIGVAPGEYSSVYARKFIHTSSVYVVPVISRENWMSVISSMGRNLKNAVTKTKKRDIDN